MGSRGIKHLTLQTPEQQAYAVFEGMRLYFEGDYEQAIRRLSRFLELEPDDATALKYLELAIEAKRVGHVPESRIPAEAREVRARAYAMYKADLLDEARANYEVARRLASNAGVKFWIDLEADIEALERRAHTKAEESAVWQQVQAGQFEIALEMMHQINGRISSEQLKQLRTTLATLLEIEAKANDDNNYLAIPETVQELREIRYALNQALPYVENSDRLLKIRSVLSDREEALYEYIRNRAYQVLTTNRTTKLIGANISALQEASQDLEIALAAGSDRLEIEIARQTIQADIAKLLQIQAELQKASCLVDENNQFSLKQAHQILLSLVDYTDDVQFQQIVSRLQHELFSRVNLALNRSNTRLAIELIRLANDFSPMVPGGKGKLAHLSRRAEKVRYERVLHRLSYILLFITLLAIILVGFIAIQSHIILEWFRNLLAGFA